MDMPLKPNILEDLAKEVRPLAFGAQLSDVPLTFRRTLPPRPLLALPTLTPRTRLQPRL